MTKTPEELTEDWKAESYIKDLMSQNYSIAKQQDFKHFTVIENEQINRYQIIFGGKPAPEIIKNLKENGFKWAPSQKAWQRQITINGKLAIKRFAEFMETIDDE